MKRDRCRDSAPTLDPTGALVRRLTVWTCKMHSPLAHQASPDLRHLTATACAGGFRSNGSGDRRRANEQYYHDYHTEFDVEVQHFPFLKGASAK